MSEVTRASRPYSPEDESAALQWWDDWRNCEGELIALKSAMCRHRITAIAAYLAALEADGFVVVPVEPSEAMLQAGDMGLSDAGVDDSTREDAAHCYRAMIAARPKGDV